MSKRSKSRILPWTLAWSLVASTFTVAAQAIQHPRAHPIEFEVASIHPTDPSALFINFHYTPSGLSIEGAPIQMILGEAFTGTGEQTSGIPAWAKNARYSIEAKVAEADAAKWRNLPRNEQRRVLQSLLEQRFALRYHTEKKPIWVFVLTVAKGGVRMKQADPSAKTHGGPVGLGHYVGVFPMSTLAMVLEGDSELDNRKIIDRTGLSARYDIDLQWTAVKTSPIHADRSMETEDAPDVPQDTSASLFSALQQQLGLKLTPQKQPSDIVVIDSLEKPSAN